MVDIVRLVFGAYRLRKKLIEKGFDEGSATDRALRWLCGILANYNIPPEIIKKEFEKIKEETEKFIEFIEKGGI